MSRLILSVLVVAAICAITVGIVLLGYWPTPRPVQPVGGGAFSSNKVPALGRLEPYDGIIPINTLPGDQVLVIQVPKKVEGKEDWSITKDQELVILRSKAIHEKEKQLAQAQLDAATKQLDAIKASGVAQVKEAELKRDGMLVDVDGDIKSLELKVGLLKDQYKVAQDTYDRMTTLGAGTVPQEDITKQRLAVRSAQVELESAQNMLERAIKGRTRSANQANAGIESLKQSVKRAEAEVPIESARLNKTLADLRYEAGLVLSPIEGQVLDVLVHVGDTTGPRPLLRVGNLATLAVIAEVDEGEVLRVHKDDEAVMKSSIVSRSLGVKEIDGAVVEVGKTVTRNTLVDVNPAALADRRVVEVKIRLNLSGLTDAQQQTLRRLVGYQLNVDILVQKLDK